MARGLRGAPTSRGTGGQRARRESMRNWLAPTPGQDVIAGRKSSGSAGSPYTLRQIVTNGAGTGSQTATATWSKATLAGSFLVALASSQGGGGFGSATNGWVQANGWTLVGLSYENAAGSCVGVYYIANASSKSGASEAFDISWSASDSPFQLTIMEITVGGATIDGIGSIQAFHDQAGYNTSSGAVSMTGMGSVHTGFVVGVCQQKVLTHDPCFWLDAVGGSLAKVGALHLDDVASWSHDNIHGRPIVDLSPKTLGTDPTIYTDSSGTASTAIAWANFYPSTGDPAGTSTGAKTNNQWINGGLDG